MRWDINLAFSLFEWQNQNLNIITFDILPSDADNCCGNNYDQISWNNPIKPSLLYLIQKHLLMIKWCFLKYQKIEMVDTKKLWFL